MPNPTVGSYRIAYDANDNPLYEGKAVRKNASTAAAVWQITKFTWTAGTGGEQVMTLQQWADGNELYDNVWDNRATTVVYS